MATNWSGTAWEGQLLALLAQQEREDLWEGLPAEAREALVRELGRVMLQAADRRAERESGQQRGDTADAP